MSMLPVAEFNHRSAVYTISYSFYHILLVYLEFLVSNVGESKLGRLENASPQNFAETWVEAESSIPSKEHNDGKFNKK